LPSPLSTFGRLTHLTGLWLTAFLSQRYSNSDDSAARRWRTVAPPELAPLEIVAPGDHMRPCHGAEFVEPHDAGEAHEVVDRVFVSRPGMKVPDIGEPLELGGHIGQPVELGGA
jgi:hypothetical protein